MVDIQVLEDLEEVVEDLGVLEIPIKLARSHPLVVVQSRMQILLVLVHILSFRKGQAEGTAKEAGRHRKTS